MICRSSRRGIVQQIDLATLFGLALTGSPCLVTYPWIGKGSYLKSATERGALAVMDAEPQGLQDSHIDT